MEAAQAVITQLYTNFILRDLVGKILPGCVLIFSFALLFASPKEIVSSISKENPIVLVVIVGGLAWTSVLGLQRVAEFVSVWEYYPKVGGKEIDIQATVVEPFLRIACTTEKLQYERYVVIKEATGNLFFCGVLSLPLWGIWLYGLLNNPATRKFVWGAGVVKVRSIIIALYTAMLLTGLFYMNVQHVNKQFDIAKRIYGEFEKSKTHACKEDEKKDGSGKG